VFVTSLMMVNDCDGFSCGAGKVSGERDSVNLDQKTPRFEGSIAAFAKATYPPEPLNRPAAIKTPDQPC
jgi:hypothetical protein